MKFLGDYRIGTVTFFIIVLSIYVAIYRRIDLNSSIAGFLGIIVFSPENYTSTGLSGRPFFPDDELGLYMSIAEDPNDLSFSLQYDYYRESCPSAERIIRRVLRKLQSVRPSVAPSLVRLLFHDCFVEGCDASILLDPDGSLDSEKDSAPNKLLKGFDVIDTIKEELENACPGIVSCADLLVFAAREAILLAGGPFYPVFTGRKDSLVAFGKMATFDIPSPQANLSDILAHFASRGFDERETVSLLGAHSIGIIHCEFVEDRLYNFSGTGKPDPSLDPVLLQELKTKCQTENLSTAPSPAPCTTSDSKNSTVSSADTRDGIVEMTFGEYSMSGSFGTRYFRRLLRNKGLLFSDQQLMANEETSTWVKAYASSPFLFHRDFAFSMMKLSNFHALTAPLGQVRRNCSKVSSHFS